MADIGRALLAVGLVFVDNYRELFVLTFVTELLSMARQPAREAVVPHLIPERHLLAANGLSLLSNYGTAPIGSALFAGLSEVGSRLPRFGTFGPSIGAAFVFDAFTFLVSALIVVSTAIPEVKLSKSRRAKGKLDLKTPLRDIGEGFRFVTRSGPIRRMILGMAAGLFGGGALFVIGQPFAEQVLRVSDAGYGLIVTSLGVGVGLGMLGVTVFATMETRRQIVFGLALMSVGVSIIATGFTKSLWAAIAWTLGTGAGTGVAYVTAFTQLHATVDDSLRGRTFATMFAFARTALLVSFALAGVGAAALDGVLAGELNEGIRAVIVLGGIVVLVVGATLLWSGREEIHPKPFDAEQLATLASAGDAITWMRGDRNPPRRPPPIDDE